LLAQQKINHHLWEKYELTLQRISLASGFFRCSAFHLHIGIIALMELIDFGSLGGSSKGGFFARSLEKMIGLN
jgi:hypothetical protein